MITITDGVMLIFTASLVYYTIIQHRLELGRTKWERYDKIYALYQKIMEFLHDVSRCEHRTTERSVQFLKETREAEFLTGNKIRTLIDDIYRQSVKLEYHTTHWNAIRGDTTHPEFQLHLTEMDKKEKWIIEQRIIVRNLFTPMLSLGNEKT